MYVSFLFVPWLTYCQNSTSDTLARMRTTGNCFVYISLDSAQCITVYRMNPADGSLQFFKNIGGGGSVGALSVDPTRRYLYAAIRSKNSILSCRINPTTGDLSYLKTIQTVGNPVYLSTDRSGRYLLSAFFADSKAAVYKIGSDGAPLDSALQVIATAKNAHAILADPSNKFLFIPCRTGETIHQYFFDESSGQLVAQSPERIRTDSLTGPRHIVFHPSLNVVYFSNEFNSTVTAYHIDTLHGTLAQFQSLSMLPPNFIGTNKAADIHLTSDHRFLYASNRGHESIAAYSVDSLSGLLTSLGQFTTEKTPRSFDIDPSGRFLYAGGQGSGKLAAYRIDPLTGRLIFLKTYNVGNNPAWVLIVRTDTGQ